MTTMQYDDRAELARLITLMTGDEKHSWSALSTLDVIWVLYDRVLNVDPAHQADPDRDRFYLSKGHGPVAYYAVLAAKGFIPAELLGSWASFDSPLGYHPDHVVGPGVELSSGSLGHGLGIAVGAALALRATGRTRPRVFCLIGDGELDEGSNFEAIQLAGRMGLEGLTCIVVDNGSSTWGWPGGIAARFIAEAWWTDVVDGRDHDALAAALGEERLGKPHAVVATIEQAH
jgi:transketolase